jgi:maltose/maltodextrin transport system substrate-binding protein
LGVANRGAVEALSEIIALINADILPKSVSYSAAEDLMDNGQIMPNIPQMGRFFSSVGAALQTATEGQTSAQAALREAEAKMRHQ